MVEQKHCGKENFMYRTKTESFVVEGNINMSVLREQSEGGGHYALMKISLFGRNTYGICVLGDGHSIEIVGNDEGEANELFDIVVNEAPEPCHMFDIITDYRRERDMQN